jgi:DNA helicase HerA-like ATPase
VNPKLDTEKVITELGVGEVLISTLDEKGVPTVVDRAFVVPPVGHIGPITPEQRQQLIANSLVAGVYEKAVDRESAYEKISAFQQARQAEQQQAEAEAAAAKEAAAKAKEERAAARAPDSVWESIGKSAVRSASSSIGRSLGTKIVRGVLGGLLGGKKSWF